MTRYAALFRGLNVGGKHRVRMADLSDMLSSLGFSGVQTLLQSGNAVLESGLAEAEVRARIAQAFGERFGFDGGVLVRSADALRALAEGLPYTQAQRDAAEAADPMAEHLYVYFLDSAPEPQQLAATLRAVAPGDALTYGDRAYYLLCGPSIRLSKTAAHLARAYPAATARNWNTLLKLAEQAGGLGRQAP